MSASTRARTLSVGALLLAGVVGACGGKDTSSDPPASGAKPTATLSATPTATPEASPTTVEPNVGDRALRVGQTRVGAASQTTLLEIRFPYPTTDIRTPETPGNKFVGLRIKQCVSKSFDPDDYDGQPYYSTLNSEFAAVAPSGNQAAGNGSSYNDWPAPKFPEYVTMNPGDCLKGWVAIEVPPRLKIKKIVWRPDGETLAEWLP